MSLAEKFKKQEEDAQKEGISQGNDGWYKFKEGDNVFRVLSEPEMIFEKFNTGICYTDCGYEGASKFMCYVLDRTDGKIKIAKLPYKIGTMIAGYEQDEDYSFNGFPMPFNVKVKAVGAGTKEVEYSTIPSPKREEIPLNIQEQLKKKAPILEIIEKMKEKKKAEHVKDGTWEANQKRKADLKADLDEVRGGKSKAVEGIEYPEGPEGEIGF